jgi:hypothetical protein
MFAKLHIMPFEIGEGRDTHQTTNSQAKVEHVEFRVVVMGSARLHGIAGSTMAEGRVGAAGSVRS